MGIALQTQGYSLNEKDPEVVKEAGKFFENIKCQMLKRLLQMR